MMWPIFTRMYRLHSTAIVDVLERDGENEPDDGIVVGGRANGTTATAVSPMMSI